MDARSLQQWPVVVGPDRQSGGGVRLFRLSPRSVEIRARRAPLGRPRQPKQHHLFGWISIDDVLACLYGVGRAALGPMR